jgi:Tfp pilus assembly protein PilO
MTDRFTSRERILLALTLAAAAAWLFYRFALGPLAAENRELSRTAANESIRLARLRKTIAQKSIFARDLERIAVLENREGARPLDSSEMLKIIDRLQRQTGVRLERLAPLEPEDIPPYRRLRARIEIRDSLENAVRFILKLSGTPEKLNLVNLRIVPERGERRRLRVDLTVGCLQALPQTETAP